MSKIDERTSISIVFVASILTVVSFGAWGYAKLDSKVQEHEKAFRIVERLDRRLYRLELKNGIKEVEPVGQDDE